MKKRPLVLLFLVYATGLVLGNLLSLSAGYLLFAALIVLLAGTITYCFLKNSKVIVISVLLTIIPLAASWQHFSAPLPGAPLIQQLANTDDYLIKGLVIGYPQLYKHTKRYNITVEQLTTKAGKTYPVSGNIQVNLLNRDFFLEYGDKVEFQAKLRPIPAYRNPGGFNYQDFMSRHGIFGSATIFKPEQIIHWEKGKGNPILAWVYQVKSRMSRFLQEQTMQPCQGILRTLVLGEKSSFSKKVQRQFQKTGTTHILSISGLHYSFVAMVFFQIIRCAILWGLPPKYLLLMGKHCKASQVAAALSLPFLIFYTILADASTASLRSLIMISVYLFGLISERNRDLYNTLASAALIILIWQPGAWREVDFQLSFISVFFLIGALSIPQPASIPIPSWLFTGLTIPFVASFAVGPLTAYHFQQISLIGFLANLVIVPISSLYIPMGLSACLLSLLSTVLGQILLAPTVWLIQLHLYLMQFFSEIPLAAINVSPPTVLQVIILSILFFTLLQLPHSRIACYALLPLLITTGLAFRPVPVPIKPDLQVTILDVGQSDASFIQFPNGENMLIDGGGTPNNRFDVGAQVTAPFLRYQKIERIDTMVLTNPHGTNLNGLKSLLRQFPVKRIWEAVPPQNQQEYDFRPYEQFKYLADLKEAPRQFIFSGQKFDFGQAQLTVLHPPQEGFQAGLNDQSLVLRLQYKQFSMLFSGDITKRGQSFLVKTQPQLLNATVLKIPHHGAADTYYSPFIEMVNPQAAVFSVGLYNRFHLPNDSLLQYYQQKGCRIYRTDYNGAITITSNGDNYQISTMVN